MATAGRAVLLGALLLAVITAGASLPLEVSLGGSGGFELGRGTDISGRTVEVIRLSCNDPCKVILFNLYMIIIRVHFSYFNKKI